MKILQSQFSHNIGAYRLIISKKFRNALTNCNGSYSATVDYSEIDMTRAFTSKFTLAICCITLFGCFGPTRAYLGPLRSSDQTATVLPQGVRLRSVNEVSVPATSSGATILPGKNVVEFTVDESNFNSPGPNGNVYSIEMVAEAGMTYAITGVRGDSRLCAFPLNESGMPTLTAPAGCALAPGARPTTRQ